MGVKHGTHLAFRPGLQSRKRGKIQRTKDRIDTNGVSVSQQPGESCGLTIRQNETNLRVRHSERLDCIFQGWRRQRYGRNLFLSFAAKACRQLGIESKLSLLHLYCLSHSFRIVAPERAWTGSPAPSDRNGQRPACSLIQGCWLQTSTPAPSRGSIRDRSTEWRPDVLNAACLGLGVIPVCPRQRQPTMSV